MYREYFEDHQVQRDWIKVRKALKGLLDLYNWHHCYCQFGFTAWLFYNHYHSGQFSDFYRMQCSLQVTDPYGNFEDELREDITMQMIYNQLEELYGFPLTDFDLLEELEEEYGNRFDKYSFANFVDSEDLANE